MLWRNLQSYFVSNSLNHNAECGGFFSLSPRNKIFMRVVLTLGASAALRSNTFPQNLVVKNLN